MRIQTDSLRHDQQGADMETKTEVWSAPKLERVSIQELTRDNENYGPPDEVEGCSPYATHCSG